MQASLLLRTPPSDRRAGEPGQAHGRHGAPLPPTHHPPTTHQGHSTDSVGGLGGTRQRKASAGPPPASPRCPESATCPPTAALPPPGAGPRQPPALTGPPGPSPACDPGRRASLPPVICCPHPLGRRPLRRPAARLPRQCQEDPLPIGPSAVAAPGLKPANLLDLRRRSRCAARSPREPAAPIAACLRGAGERWTMGAEARGEPRCPAPRHDTLAAGAHFLLYPPGTAGPDSQPQGLR